MGKWKGTYFMPMKLSVFQVLNLLQSISLFATPTFIELRNAELIKDKKEIEELVAWIKKQVQMI